MHTYGKHVWQGPRVHSRSQARHLAAIREIAKMLLGADGTMLRTAVGAACRLAASALECRSEAELLRRNLAAEMAGREEEKAGREVAETN